MSEKEKRDWKSVPFYKNSPAIAREKGELDAYRASSAANRACAKAIEAAVSENWDGSRLKEGCARQVMGAFGTDRVMFLMANTIHLREYDGRFSRDNRAWAQMVHPENIPEERRSAWEINVHTDKLDEFARQTREAIEAEATLETPVYRESYQYAVDNEETGPFWTSHQCNVDCRNAIDEAIADHYDGYSLQNSASEAVLKRFGEERTLYVLANSIQLLRDDGRVSRKNIQWAEETSIPHETPQDNDIRRRFLVRTHPGLFDLFTKVTREAAHKTRTARLEQKIAQQQKTPSILAKLENRAAPSAEKINLTKKKDQVMEP